MPDRVVLLGAEKQAATSAALAYPERQFRFVSDQPVLDGWDLPNVTFTHGTPGNVPLGSGEQAVALCPRWLPAAEQKPLSEVLPYLTEALPDQVLPVSPTPVPGQPCIVKGDRFHRPDGTITGTDLDPADVGDPYGCGTLYQSLWPAEQTILVVGRHRFGACDGRRPGSRGELRRDDILAAGETVDIEADDLLRLSMTAVAILDHTGPFTMNWLKRGAEYRLTSFRPAPRAVFGTLRKAGIDLLAPAAGRGPVRPARPEVRRRPHLHLLPPAGSMNVLVLSATASAINYMRALGGRPDLKLILSDASPYAAGLYGAGVTPLLVPRARDLAKYREALDRLIAEYRIDLLIPTSDHDVEGVMELLHAGWAPPVRLFKPDYAVYRTLTHKANLMHALERAGLRTIRVYGSPDEVKFPAVVKPAREGGSKGGVDRPQPQGARRPARGPAAAVRRRPRPAGVHPRRHREHLRGAAPVRPRRPATRGGGLPLAPDVHDLGRRRERGLAGR